MTLDGGWGEIWEVGDGELSHRPTQEIRGRYPAGAQHNCNLVVRYPTQTRQGGRGRTGSVICLLGGVVVGHGMNLPRTPALANAEA